MPAELTPDPGAVVRMPPMPPLPPRSRAPIVLGIVAVLLVLVIGIAIGRATVGEPDVPAMVAATSDRGRLEVISVPANGNVTLDGRFVGVAPLENLDLDPGKHSIVIDVFGFQPYAGTIKIEPRGNAKLTVSLAPLGVTETTSRKVSGSGTSTRVAIPPSALAPPGPPATTADAKPGTRPPSSSPPTRPVIVAPQRPRRDCSGENRTCRDGCYRADSDCRFSCPGCTSCLTSVGWEECKRQCDACRNGCEQNNKFCESSCSTQQSNCNATQ